MTGEKRLAKLDERFVTIYEATRRRLLDEQKARALILINDDHMILYHGSKAPTIIAGLRPPLYEKLKTLSHVPLAIYCLLTSQTEDSKALSQDVLTTLRDYHLQLSACSADLNTTEEAEGGVLPHKLGILECSLAFLGNVVAKGQVSQSDLTSFCRANVADIHASFTAASKVQLDACHAHMMNLKENMLSVDEWASLRVVIMGPHMAHKDENLLQYFSRLLHTPMYADKRVVYFEGSDVGSALDLMGTSLLDRRASRSIFHDENRLHRDVLADATTRYLDKLFPI